MGSKGNQNILELKLEMEDNPKFVANTAGVYQQIPIVTEAKTTDKSKSMKQCWKRYIGICCGLAASLLCSVGLLFAKLLDHYEPSTIGLWKSFGLIIPSIAAWLFYRFGLGVDLYHNTLSIAHISKFKLGILLLIRGICGIGGMILQIYSIEYITLPDSSVIALSTPVFVTLVARIFLGEKCGVIPVLAGILTFIGVSVISRPPMLTGEVDFDISALIGTAFALTAMTSSVVVFIILRYLREIHFAVMMTVLGAVGIVECALVSGITSSLDLPHSGSEWGYGIAAGLFTFLGTLLLTLAFKYEEAGPIALTRTCDVIFAFILEYFFLGIVPDLFSLLGSSIVMFAIIIILIRKWLSDLPEGDTRRENCSFFLK